MANSSLRNEYRRPFFLCLTHQLQCDDSGTYKKLLDRAFAVQDQELLQQIGVFNNPLTPVILIHEHRESSAHAVLLKEMNGKDGNYRTFLQFQGPGQHAPYDNATYATSLFPELTYYDFCCEVIRWMVLYKDFQAAGLRYNTGFYFPKFVYSGCQTRREHHYNNTYSYDVNFVRS